MSAQLILVAEAVAEDLRNGSFALPFECRRSYETEMELKDTGKIRVDVVPVDPGFGVESRVWIAANVLVDVGIRYKFAAESLDSSSGQPVLKEVDALVELVQDLAVYLSLKRLTAYSGAAFLSVESRAGWVPEHLREWHQFTAAFRVGYRTSIPAGGA